MDADVNTIESPFQDLESLPQDVVRIKIVISFREIRTILLRIVTRLK